MAWQPDVAEMQYQLGVVYMQQSKFEQAAAAYERALKLDGHHRGAFVNGVHCLQQMPPADKQVPPRSPPADPLTAPPCHNPAPACAPFGPSPGRGEHRLAVPRSPRASR